MVPFSAFAKGEWIYGAPKLSRYNGVEAMENPRCSGARLFHR